MSDKEHLNQLIKKIISSERELESIELKLASISFIKKMIGTSVDKSRIKHLKSLIYNWQTDANIAIREILYNHDSEYRSLADKNISLLSKSVFKLDFTNDYSDFTNFIAGTPALLQESAGTAGYYEGNLSLNKISFKSKTVKRNDLHGMIGIATRMEGHINYLGQCFLKPVETKRHIRPAYYEATIDENGKMTVKSVGDTLIPMHPFGFNILYGDVFNSISENGIQFFKNVNRLFEIINAFKKTSNINF